VAHARAETGPDDAVLVHGTPLDRPQDRDHAPIRLRSS
jgi:hypothetical protein